jgi:hopanoid biosynthesis associated RND transporter like protein HpnN
MISIQDGIRALLRGSGGVISRHYRAIVIAGLLLTVAAAVAAGLKWKVSNNTSDLISKDSLIHSYYLDYRDDFNVREDIVVVLRSDSFERNTQAAEALAGLFKDRPADFLRVYYRHDFSRLEKKLLNYLDAQELKDVRNKIHALREFLASPNRDLNLNSLLDETLAKFDDKYLREAGNWDEFKPFIDDFVANLNALADELEGKAKAPAPPAGDKTREVSFEQMQAMLRENQYLTADGGRMVMMLLTPGDIEESPYHGIIERVRADVEEVRKSYPDVRIGITGEPVLSDDELQLSTSDSILASVITLVLISALFFFAYRELLRPALAIAALLCSVAWTMGFTMLVVGHLNVISQACVIMILGMGIDFGIQMLARIEEEMAEGHGLHEALATTLEQAGLAIVTGGSTTAIAFYTMCFNDFVGLAEFGVIAGTGVLFAVAANLFLLPAFLLWVHRRHELAGDHEDEKVAVPPSRESWLDRQIYSKPWLAVGVSAVLTVFFAWQGTKVVFDYNLLNMQNREMEGVKLVQDLIHTPNNSVLFGVLVAKDFAEMERMREALLKLPTVKGVRSLKDVFPQDSAEKREAIAGIGREVGALKPPPPVSSKVNVAKARRDLASLLASSREGLAQARKFTGIAKQARDAVEVFDKLIPPLERAVATFGKLSQAEVEQRLNRYDSTVFGEQKRQIEWLKKQNFAEPIVAEDVPPELRERYQSKTGRYLLEVEPKEDVWDRAAAERFTLDLRKVSERATGTPVQNYEYINLLRDSYVQAGIYAFVAIIILVGLHFFDLSRLALTLIPLLLAMTWSVGIMGLFRMPFNPANIITLPLVIGVGVAFGVYVVERHREEGRVRLFGSSTGKAVFLSASTTIISFASMMVGKYPGMVSLGRIMTLGITCCLITSIFVLPQMLVLWDRYRGKGQGARG